uniref:MARVEL domain-containing protein n=1 Tax=Arion vulgaris TaxID=1028688 RepID=A0A0B7B586_9EUPU
MSNCCLRCMLTVLHALIGMGAGFFCLFSLIGWDFDATFTLPSLIDQFGKEIKSSNGLLVVYDSIVYGMAVVSLFNFIACLIINWQWQSTCIAFLNLLLSVAYIAAAVMGGTAMVVYYIVWCDSLERRFGDAHGCEDAAQRYDLYNATGKMSLYRSRMEVQMVSIWILFFLICFSTFFYSLIVRIFAKPDARDGRFRYYIIHDEMTPLLHSENDNTPRNESIHATGTRHSLPNVASVSTNPFEN